MPTIIHRIAALIVALAFAATPAQAWLKPGAATAGPPATLSAQTGLADGTDHAILSVSTTVGSGTLYYVISNNCATPSATQIIQGKDAGGGAPVPGAAGSQPVTSTGVQNANPSGLTGVNTYCAHYAQLTSGNSNAVSSTSFTTGGALTITANYGTTWNAVPAETAAFTAVINDTLQFLSDCFTAKSNLTLIITFERVTTANAGNSGGITLEGKSYASVLRPAFQSLPNQNAFQRSSYAALPSTNPEGTDGQFGFGPSLQAIGVTCSGCPVHPAADATISFSNGANLYDTTVGNGICPNNGKYCLSNVAQHEITEVMGRISHRDLGIYTMVDAQTWSAQGVRNFSTSPATIYLSQDDGTHSVLPPLHGGTFTSFSNTFGQGGGDKLDEVGLFFLTPSPFSSQAGTAGGTPFGASQIQTVSLAAGWGVTHSCRITGGL